MNKIKITQFQNLLKKGTINFSIDNIGMKFDSDSYRVSMRGSDSVVILEGPNNIISGIKKTDTWVLNFSDPSKNVRSYFDLIIPDENDEANIEMKDEKIIIKSDGQKTSIFFCSDHIISGFDGDGPKVAGDDVFITNMSRSFMDVFNLIKKIASGFGKVYFTVDNGELSIESTDKTNSFANGMKMVIGESLYMDISLCFDYKTLNNVISLIGSDFEEFSIRIGYSPARNAGLISIIKNDKSERYYVLSTREYE